MIIVQKKVYNTDEESDDDELDKEKGASNNIIVNIKQSALINDDLVEYDDKKVQVNTLDEEYKKMINHRDKMNS